MNMPTSFVKTPEDEKKWNKAKELASQEGHKDDYAYITGIYKKMKNLESSNMKLLSYIKFT